MVLWGERWYVPKLRERIPEFTPVDRPRAIPIEMSKEVLPVLKGRDHRMRRSSRSNTYLDVPPNPRKLERERSSTLATNHAIRTHLFKPNSSPSFGILDVRGQHHTPSMSTITRTKSCMRSLIVSKSNAASQCPVSINEHKRAPKKKKTHASNPRCPAPVLSHRPSQLYTPTPMPAQHKTHARSSTMLISPDRSALTPWNQFHNLACQRGSIFACPKLWTRRATY